MIIAPKILKGFRDSLPAQELVRRDTLLSLERSFRSHGLVPIDTPALEYREILLGKGGGDTDKQVYSFQDNGGREVALRFDLTVPFARFMAMHSNELGLPFKRYHMAKVWRGENTQKGRYREFYQCDFDIVGVDTPSADFEVLSIIMDSLDAIGLADYRIHISHRGLFNEFLTHSGAADASVEILRTVDKLGKIGLDATRELLETIVSRTSAADVLDFITCGSSLSGDQAADNRTILARLEDLIGGPCEHSRRIRAILDFLADSGAAERVVLDPSITRGLDYYTGIVYETFLDAIPGIGSICSGGRYNDLASLYTREVIPGVGASIGLDRLLAALEELRPPLAENGAIHKSADVLIICMEEELTGYYAGLAADFRKAGLSAEMYHSKRKVSQQFRYAERRGIPYAVIAGETERLLRRFNFRNLKTFQEEHEITVEEALSLIEKEKL